MLGLHVELDRLRSVSDEFERKLSELIQDQPELSASSKKATTTNSSKAKWQTSNTGSNKKALELTNPLISPPIYWGVAPLNLLRGYVVPIYWGVIQFPNRPSIHPSRPSPSHILLTTPSRLLRFRGAFPNCSNYSVFPHFFYLYCNLSNICDTILHCYFYHRFLKLSRPWSLVRRPVG